VRWSEFLSRFNFKIIDRLGKASIKPDALTHQASNQSEDSDKRLIYQEQTVLKAANLHIASVKIASPDPLPSSGFAPPSALLFLD
jgi:hypothetical protein